MLSLTLPYYISACTVNFIVFADLSIIERYNQKNKSYSVGYCEILDWKNLETAVFYKEYRDNNVTHVSSSILYICTYF